MYNVIVLGITGAGKSQLCNFLFDDIENCRYKVGNELFSCTYMKDIIEAEKQGKTILNGKFNLIDSPGGDDSKGNDLENLEEFIKYLHKKGRIDCILLVLNYRNKISNSIKEYLKKLSHLFKPSEFYNHLINLLNFLYILSILMLVKIIIKNILMINKKLLGKISWKELDLYLKIIIFSQFF